MRIKPSVAIIGAGNRGTDYASFTQFREDSFEVVAVAEPDAIRREHFMKTFQLNSDQAYLSWEEFFAFPKMCDAVLVTTQDDNHYQPVMKALAKGYHVLVEKPLSPNIYECQNMIELAAKQDRMLLLAYVLRYTPFFKKIKEIITSKQIGEVRHISIDMNVAYWHQAHSFVRGNWRNSEQSSPMILAKSCHDFDIIYHLMDSKCTSISSFGDLIHFKEENAPTGATRRCLDGCLVEENCPYSAKKIYLSSYTAWPVNTISTDLSIEARKKAIQKGPYGRCVYHCDNNVVDHQVVNLQFENGATATLTMSGFTEELERNVRINGTHGELTGSFNKNIIHLQKFGHKLQEFVMKPSSFGRHAGGDYGLMKEFTKRLQHDQTATNNDKGMMISHLLAHAAEESRLRNTTMNIDQYKREKNIDYTKTSRVSLPL